MKKTYQFFLAFAICSMVSSYAAKTEQKIEKFDIKKLEVKYQSMQGMTADFSQEVYQASLARTKTSTGILIISKPLYVRWETHKPDQTILVSNGQKLWYFDPHAGVEGKGQVIQKNANGLSDQPVIQILNGRTEISKKFTVTQKSENNEATLELLPKHRMPDVEKLAIKVDKQSYFITEIIIFNRSGNRSKISLQNIKVSDKLPSTLFNFSPPAGAELVKE